jgi:hypothetical protein
VHSGVPHKVNAALDEIVRLGDPALFDWLLEAAHVEDLGSTAWNWKYDKCQKLEHPSLEPEQALKLVAHGTSRLAQKLRKNIKRLGIELGFNRRDESHLDVSMIGGLPDVTYLRIMAKEIESLYEWRAEMAKRPAKLLFGFDMIAGMSSLERLVVIGGGGTSFTPLVELKALADIELVACDIKDTAELARLATKKLALIACPQIESLDVLPPQLEHLHVEDLPLTSIAGLASAKHLETVHVAGVPLEALPKLPKSVKVTFHRERPERTKM